MDALVSPPPPRTPLAGRHPIATFFLLTYAISWGLWLPIVLGYEGALRGPLFVAGIFGPAFAGALVTWRSGRSVAGWLRDVLRVRVGVRWYLVALLIPAAVVAVVSAAYALLGHAVDPGVLPGRGTAYVLALVATALLGGGQEEFGWRGFALPRLERRYGPVAGTLVLGVLWGLWHLPIVATDPAYQHGLEWAALAPVIGLSLVSVIGYAFLLTWLFNRTGSVVLTMLLHAGFNTANELLVPIPLEAAEGAAYGVLSVVMTLTLVVLSLGLVVATRGTLGYAASSVGGPPAEHRRDPYGHSASASKAVHEASASRSRTSTPRGGSVSTSEAGRPW